MKDLYFGMSNSIIAASQKLQHWWPEEPPAPTEERESFVLEPQLVTLELRCHRNAHFACSHAVVALMSPSYWFFACCFMQDSTYIFWCSTYEYDFNIWLALSIGVGLSNSGGHIMFFKVCLLDRSRREKNYISFLAAFPVPCLPKYIAISVSRQGGVMPWNGLS